MSDSTWCKAVPIYIFIPLGIFLLCYLYRLWIGGRSYHKTNQIPDKVVIVTGSNSGIGKETAIELAKRGAKVYMACRSLERGNEALEEIKRISGSDNVHLRQLDLASMKSIREFAESFLQEETRLDILINNAGLMACPKYLTEDGFEMQIGVNHLGHFLLTNLLLDLIKKSEPSRIVNVASFVQSYGKIFKEDLMGEKYYSHTEFYYQSKLAIVMVTKELARRLKDTKVSVFSLNPGPVNTNIFRYNPYGLVIGTIWSILQPFILKTPKQGAQTSLTCALDSEIESHSGEYFDNCRPGKMNPLVDDENLVKWVWEESEKYIETKIDV